MLSRVSVPGVIALAIGVTALVGEGYFALLSTRMRVAGLSGVGAVLGYLLGFLGTTVGIQQIFTKAFAHGRRASLVRGRVFFPMVGRAYLAMMSALFIGSVIGRSNPMLLVFCLMATPWVFNGFIAYTQLRQISVLRETPIRCEAGQIVPITIKLRNRRRRFAVWMFTVVDRIDGPLGGTVRMKSPLEPRVAFLRVPKLRMLRRAYRVRFPRRGKYEFGPLRADTRFPLGLIERGLIVPDQSSILVHPRIGVLSPDWRQRLRRAREQVSQAQSRAGSFDDDFHRVRDYQTGDDPRSVHWPTSARRGSLVVREFRESRDQPLTIALDLSSPDGEDNAVTELALDLAATIAVHHSRTSQRAGVTCLIGGRELVEWSSSSRHDIGGLLDRLAVIVPSSTSRQIDLQSAWVTGPRTDSRLVWIATESLPADPPAHSEQILVRPDTVATICEWPSS